MDPTVTRARLLACALASRRAAALALAAMVGGVGCMGAAARSVRGGTEELVRLKEDGTLGKLAPQIEVAARDAVAGALEGGLDTLDDEARRAQIRRASDLFAEEVDQIVRAAGHGLGEELRLQIVETTEEVLDRASRLDLDVSSAAAEVTRRTIDTAARSLARGLDDHVGPAARRLVAEQLGPGLAQAVRDDLGPGLAQTLRDDLGPALGKVVREDLGPALAGAARATSYEGGAGLSQALSEALDPEREGSLGARLRGTLETGRETIEKWLLLALVAAVALLSAFLFLWARARIRERLALQQAQAREASLLLVAESIREAHEHDAQRMVPYRDAIRRLGRTPERRNALGELEKFLVTRPGLELPSRDGRPK